jgi:hypothetical protein
VNPDPPQDARSSSDDSAITQLVRGRQRSPGIPDDARIGTPGAGAAEAAGRLARMASASSFVVKYRSVSCRNLTSKPRRPRTPRASCVRAESQSPGR